MTKTYEHKYNLGEKVWIKSDEDIRMEVMIRTVGLPLYPRYSPKLMYMSFGGDSFYEDEVIEPTDLEKEQQRQQDERRKDNVKLRLARGASIS